MASGVDAAQARQGGVQARDARRAAAAGWQHAQAGAARMAGMEVVAWAARSHPQGGRRGAGELTCVAWRRPCLAERSDDGKFSVACAGRLAGAIQNMNHGGRSYDYDAGG